MMEQIRATRAVKDLVSGGADGADGGDADGADGGGAHGEDDDDGNE